MTRKILRSLYLLAFIASLVTATAFYKSRDPKSQLIKYHDSGKYYADISSVIREASYYLQFRITQNGRTQHQRKLAIVMDIDETALSNYTKLLNAGFSINTDSLKQIEAKDEDPAIPYTLAFYNYAKDHGIAIFFITGRATSIKHLTIGNLDAAGYHRWDGISFNSGSKIGSASIHYRATQRKQIRSDGYDIIMNIGNRDATLAGGFSDMTFKLPNPFYKLS